MSGTGRGRREGRGLGRLWPLFVGLPLITLLAVGAIVLSGGGQEEAASPPAGKGPEGGGRAARLGTPSLGSADAPVVLTEYSDYQ